MRALIPFLVAAPLLSIPLLSAPLLPALAAPAPDDDGPFSDSPRQITIINHSARRIESVHISSSKADGWGSDLLGHDEIDPSSQGVIAYRGPCRSDIQINFEGGAVESRRFLDLCRQTNFVIEPGWTLASQVSSGT